MQQELLEIIIPLDLRYQWSAGPHLGAFLRALKDRRKAAMARSKLPDFWIGKLTASVSGRKARKYDSTR